MPYPKSSKNQDLAEKIPHHRVGPPNHHNLPTRKHLVKQTMRPLPAPYKEDGAGYLSSREMGGVERSEEQVRFLAK